MIHILFHLFSLQYLLLQSESFDRGYKGICGYELMQDELIYLGISSIMLLFFMPYSNQINIDYNSTTGVDNTNMHFH